MAIKEVRSEAPKSASSKEEQIGFHKGALTTLAKEREEMLKILNIVEQLMQMHVAGLKELGVDLAKISKDSQAGSAKKTPLENKLR